MSRYTIILFLAFFYCMSFMAQAQAAETEGQTAGQRLLGIFAPGQGAWSEYAIFDKATGRRTVLRVSIVGIEQDAFWYEMEKRDETGASIVKLQVKGDPLYPENIGRIIIKSGPGPARELGGEIALMDRLKAGEIFEQEGGIPRARATDSLKSIKTATGEATVVAGTFEVSLYEIVDQAGTVYARYKYSQQVRPFGIVSTETESTTMVLVGHGTGAESVITEEPVMMSTQPSGPGERGRIMQIPGMGTGYEPKE